MTNSIKRQRFISSVLLMITVTGLAQHFLHFNVIKPSLHNFYIYGYSGIIILCLLNILLANINVKYSIVPYIYLFLELHFITLLFFLPYQNISIYFLFIALFRIGSMVKGRKGLLLTTIFGIINYMFSALLASIFDFPPIYPVNIYILEIISIISIGLFLYLVTKDYEKTFYELEQSHVETTKNNQLLNNTIAELSTIQEISKFANSVLNIKELINIINDMIIGVIGVNYCSIFLIDENTNNFYLESTNIQDKNILQNIKLTLASKYVNQFKSRGLAIAEGSIADVQNYPNASERDIKTFLIAPLQSHRNFLGLIVTESCFSGAFEERKKNMITTICNQVSIAIENAVIYDKMEKLATIDGLTQVHNRRYFNETCLSEFGTLSASAPISIAMIDIDNFKKLNDTYGHLLGDVVLKKVASIINSTTCASNSEDFLVARYGGEEFVILMKKTDLNTAYTILEVVRKNIEAASVEDDGQIIKFAVSIGVAEYPTTSNDVKQILKDADTALYKAKETGKNRVIMADKLN